MKNGLSPKPILLSICLFVLASNIMAQSDKTDKPCSAPEASQFDFWIGKWDLTWGDSMKGTNIITKELDGCVVHENFSDPKDNFTGRSYSVFDPAEKLWKQTWVDNQGSYLDFKGSFENEKMTLSRSYVGPKGKTVMQRMIFFNITENSIEWRWESSLDNGKTWKQNWLIHYKRAK